MAGCADAIPEPENWFNDEVSTDPDWVTEVGTFTVMYNATTTVRDAISASAGDTLYNTTLNRTQVYNGSAWVSNSLSTDIPTNTNQLTNGAGFATLASPTFTGTVSGISSTMVGLGNVTNESKATMFTDPTFTGTMAGTFEGTRQETFNITEQMRLYRTDKDLYDRLKNSVAR